MRLLLQCMPDRQLDIESCAFTRERIRFYKTIMLGHYFFTEREAYACAFIRIPVIEALKQPEYFMGILLVKSNTVVFHKNFHHFPVAVRHDHLIAYMYFRRYIGPAKFERIVQEVVKQLFHLHGNRIYLR